MSERRLLVACVGNIFLGDDGFGVEVARRLAGRPLPEGVQVVDFGIRGLDLAYALLDEPATILVDALPRGGPPGTLYVLEPDLDELAQAEAEPVDTHGMHPLSVLRLVTALGGSVGSLVVVGCEPESGGPEDDWQMGLSPAVEAAVDEAAGLVELLARQILSGGASADGRLLNTTTATLATATEVCIEIGNRRAFL